MQYSLDIQLTDLVQSNCYEHKLIVRKLLVEDYRLMYLWDENMLMLGDNERKKNQIPKVLHGMAVRPREVSRDESSKCLLGFP